MAKIKKIIQQLSDKPVISVLSVFVYAAMLVMIFMFFESGGEFIYEGF